MAGFCHNMKPFTLKNIAKAPCKMAGKLTSKTNATLNTSRNLMHIQCDKQK